MLARRIALFLIGAWIGCGLLMAVLFLENPSSPDLVMNSARTSPAAQLVELAGAQSVRTLLRYQAAEQTRTWAAHWEEAQMALAVMLLVSLVMFDHKRWAALGLCGAMLILVLFQYFRITPEMIARGRETDFLSEDAGYMQLSQLRTLTEFFVGTETLKLLCGGVLAAFLFATDAAARVKKRRSRSVTSSPNPSIPSNVSE